MVCLATFFLRRNKILLVTVHNSSSVFAHISSMFWYFSFYELVFELKLMSTQSFMTQRTTLPQSALIIDDIYARQSFFSVVPKRLSWQQSLVILIILQSFVLLSQDHHLCTRSMVAGKPNRVSSCSYAFCLLVVTSCLRNKVLHNVLNLTSPMLL